MKRNELAHDDARFVLVRADDDGTIRAFARLNWRCWLQSGQSRSQLAAVMRRGLRLGKYVRGALRSLNSVLAMRSLCNTSSK